MVAQCGGDPPPEISAVLGSVSLAHDVYLFKSIHDEDDQNGTFVLALDQGWTPMRETQTCVPVEGMLETISETATSRLVRLTIRSTDGCPLNAPEGGSSDPMCEGCLVAPPEGSSNYVGVRLQLVGDGTNNAESRKLDIDGATQLRSIRSHLYVDGQEILLGTNGLLDPFNPLTTLTNVGLSPFFLEDGFVTSSGDDIVFYDPFDPTNQDYPGYRLIGTPGDLTVNPTNTADQAYSGVVLHLYNRELYEVDKIEIDLLFDVASPGDTD
ncbi:MAG: hypothetical protein K8E66_04265, partial [Phycisphaerales bacterium]|nr:hypothetical protein [Phycisphaerales bacterium]